MKKKITQKQVDNAWDKVREIWEKAQKTWDKDCVKAREARREALALQRKFRDQNEKKNI